jgi:hypothetical protein
VYAFDMSIDQPTKCLIGKVFSRLNFAVPDSLLQGAATGKEGVIEFILSTLRSKVQLSNEEGSSPPCAAFKSDGSLPFTVLTPATKSRCCGLERLTLPQNLATSKKEC